MFWLARSMIFACLAAWASSFAARSATRWARRSATSEGTCPGSLVRSSRNPSRRWRTSWARTRPLITGGPSSSSPSSSPPLPWKAVTRSPTSGGWPLEPSRPTFMEPSGRMMLMVRTPFSSVVMLTTAPMMGAFGVGLTMTCRAIVTSSPEPGSTNSTSTATRSPSSGIPAGRPGLRVMDSRSTARNCISSPFFVVTINVPAPVTAPVTAVKIPTYPLRVPATFTF